MAQRYNTTPSQDKDIIRGMRAAEEFKTSYTATDKNGNTIFSADYSGKKPKIIDNRVGGGLSTKNTRSNRGGNKTRKKQNKGNNGK